ncbi:SPDY domain-containing protein [Streptomyces aculeolatus]
MEAPLYSGFPIDPSAPMGAACVYSVRPRHLAGDDGRPYDAVADALGGLGWTCLTTVRGRREPDEAPEDRQVLRSTVLHISPDSLCWAQWVLADEPFHLGDLPIAWQVSARTDTSSLAAWSAYFTTGVPGEAVADLLAALDAHTQPAAPLVRPELVVDAVTAHGWLRDADQSAGATDPTVISHVSLGEVPPLIQDADPRTLTGEPDEPGPHGWQAWAQLAPDAPYLRAASFSASVPNDLVAAFAASLSSTVSVLRRVVPGASRERLQWRPVG